MIVWDEFMPTAAIGALAIISIPLLIVGIPLYFIGRAAMHLMDRMTPPSLSRLHRTSGEGGE